MKKQIIYLEPGNYQVNDSDGFSVCFRKEGSDTINCKFCLEGKIIFKARKNQKEVRGMNLKEMFLKHFGHPFQWDGCGCVWYKVLGKKFLIRCKLHKQNPRAFGGLLITKKED